MSLRSCALGMGTTPGILSRAQMRVTHLTSQGGPTADHPPCRKRRPIPRSTTRRAPLFSSKSRTSIDYTSPKTPLHSLVTNTSLRVIRIPPSLLHLQRRFRRPSNPQKSPPTLATNKLKSPPLLRLSLSESLLSSTSNKRSFAKKSR